MRRMRLRLFNSRQVLDHERDRSLTNLLPSVFPAVLLAVHLSRLHILIARLPFIRPTCVLVGRRSSFLRLR